MSITYIASIQNTGAGIRVNISMTGETDGYCGGFSVSGSSSASGTFTAVGVVNGYGELSISTTPNYLKFTRNDFVSDAFQTPSSMTMVTFEDPNVSLTTPVTTLTINNYSYQLLHNGTVLPRYTGSDQKVRSLINTLMYDRYFFTVKSLENCFKNCTTLIYPPVIPTSVTSMKSCFEGCTNLVHPPKIPYGVTNIQKCFKGCTNLKAPKSFIIPNSVKNCSYAFDGCTNLCHMPTFLGSLQYAEYCFRNTSIEDFRGFPKVSVDAIWETAGGTNLVYGSQEMNNASSGGLRTDDPVSPYYNCSINNLTWPTSINSTKTGNLNLKSILTKLVDISRKVVGLSAPGTFQYPDTCIKINADYGNYTKAALNYCNTTASAIYQNTLTDSTSAAILQAYAECDGLYINRLISTPNIRCLNERTVTSSKSLWSHHNTTAPIYVEGSYKSVIWQTDGFSHRGFIKHMRTSSGLINTPGKVSSMAIQSGDTARTLIYQLGSWGTTKNSGNPWNDVLMGITFLQWDYSWDMTYYIMNLIGIDSWD